MAQLTTLARPYARAAFEVAEEKSEVKAWLETLTDLALLIENSHLRDYVLNPKVSAEDSLALFKDILKSILSAGQINFLRVLCEARKLILLPEIAELFTKAALSADKTVTVEVSSAKALTTAQQDALQKALENKLQQKVELNYNLAPELIGGAVIRTDEWVMDGSVQGKLAQLKRTLVG